MPVIDVLVVGGGPAGVACALALHARGLRVVLAERWPWGPPGLPGETLPGRARLALEALGVADILDDRSCTPIRAQRSRWGSAVRERSLMQDPYGHGWHIDRARFDQRLRSRAAELGVDVRLGMRCTSVSAEAASWRVTLDQDRGRSSLRASFVVDATGRTAFVARALGARRARCDRSVALVAEIPGGPGCGAVDGTTLVEVCPAGWWYAVASAAQGIALTFISDTALIPTMASDRLAALRDHVRTAPLIARFVAGARGPSCLRVVSAAPGAISPMTGDGWLATGDAMAVHDPLVFSGITKALEHGRVSAAAVAACLGGDLAALDRLRAQGQAELRAHLQMRRAYHAVTGLTRYRFWRERACPPVQPAPALPVQPVDWAPAAAMAAFA